MYKLEFIVIRHKQFLHSVIYLVSLYLSTTHAYKYVYIGMILCYFYVSCAMNCKYLQIIFERKSTILKSASSHGPKPSYSVQALHFPLCTISFSKYNRHTCLIQILDSCYITPERSTLIFSPTSRRNRVTAVHFGHHVNIQIVYNILLCDRPRYAGLSLAITNTASAFILTNNIHIE